MNLFDIKVFLEELVADQCPLLAFWVEGVHQADHLEEQPKVGMLWSLIGQVFAVKVVGGEIGQTLLKIVVDCFLGNWFLQISQLQEFELQGLNCQTVQQPKLLLLTVEIQQMHEPDSRVDNAKKLLLCECALKF